MKGPFVIAVVVALAGFVATARADMSKQAARPGEGDKMPASARVFVLDKEAPATDKTAPLPRTPPTLKQK